MCLPDTLEMLISVRCGVLHERGSDINMEDSNGRETLQFLSGLSRLQSLDLRALGADSRDFWGMRLMPVYVCFCVFLCSWTKEGYGR